MKSRKQKSSHQKREEERFAKVITLSLLKKWPLPRPDEESDKEGRGRVLVVGGSTEMPGALILAATAALRAGAGKLRMATCRSVAGAVAAAVPEARVIQLAESEEGCISTSAARAIAESANKVQALLVGPGMTGGEALMKLVLEVLQTLKRPTLILDADALSCLKTKPECLYALNQNVVLTPHAEEIAEILSMKKEDVTRDAASIASRAARRFNAIVTLKGAETFIASPAGEIFINRAGNVGLATSGSGDVLSGIIAGLAARGAEPLQAAIWGVALHARAGDRLAKSFAPLGFLARELPAEIPALMASLENQGRSRKTEG